MEETKKIQNKPSLNDIQITISLAEFWRNNDFLVFSEERYLSVANQPGFSELVHVYSYEVEGRKLFKLTKMTDWIVNSKAKDEERKRVETIELVAKSKHQIIEAWKKETMIKLSSLKMDKKQSENIILRCMNPERDADTGKLTPAGERDKRFAEKLNYPYREGLETITDAENDLTQK